MPAPPGASSIAGGMVSIRLRRFLLQSSGRVRTCLTVPIAQPRTTLCVLQVASTLRIFLREMGSSREVSYLSLGRKSLLMARKRFHVICRLLVGPPWIIPMKSLRYSSMWDRDVARVCGDRASQLLWASSVASAYSSEVCGGLVSAKSSRWCNSAVWRVERVSNVRSLTVLVVAQKKT